MDKFKLKYLPKLCKRDKVKLQKRVYVASVNGVVEEFPSKMALFNYLELYRKQFNEISDLSLTRVDIYELDEFNLKK